MRYTKYIHFTLLAGALSMAAIAGCSNAQLQQVANLQTQVQHLCDIATPTLASMQAAAPSDTMTNVQDQVQQVCGNVAQIDTTSVRNLVNTTVPTLVGLVANSNLDAQKKQLVTAGLLGSQTAILLLLPT